MEIRRDQVALLELPIATVSQMIARVNSSGKHQMPLKDFLLFNTKQREEDSISPDAAWVAIELKREGGLPHEFLVAWSGITEIANKNSRIIDTRAFKSDCGNIWIIAPKIINGRVKGLAMVKNFLSGTIKVRDIDKTLHTIYVEIPRAPDFCYIEDTKFKIVPRDKLEATGKLDC